MPVGFWLLAHFFHVARIQERHLIFKKERRYPWPRSGTGTLTFRGNKMSSLAEKVAQLYTLLHAMAGGLLILFACMLQIWTQPMTACAPWRFLWDVSLEPPEAARP